MNDYRFVVDRNAVRYVDANGTSCAEVTFPDVGDNTVEIDHTFVDDSLRGRGIAGQLLERCVRSLEETGRKAIPTCFYAMHWFEKHPERGDLLA
ncbi:putative acetyltransferase [Coriobacterium glomerans PW2]|uniref:Acetyltransferase n=1 Tax=Coriobacterium glomerans (strain ATCC 49209 / DSM 20642 / JCM 10262 / PW2) TaxID=700015 RepID=F2N9U5_CORGP|nr:GNAT family N-acetyltransferase [Coriobacterium glomerans]AEB06200.1 putative acetyltransferase [Coriobacterium glomerans PW2]